MEKTKMSNKDRAKQFLPFDALEGYFTMVNESAYEKTPRKELASDEQDRLSKILSSFKKNDIVKITYYDIDHYKTVEGVVSRLDYQNGFISVVKNKISIFDIIFVLKIDNI